MPAELNHTIVRGPHQARRRHLHGRPPGPARSQDSGPFVPVETSNGVTLDFLDSDADEITPQHVAFLVSEDEFVVRIRRAGLTHYAAPARQQPGQISHDGGRGTSFDDPNGHNLEILTRPYGST
jgi:hypothetical protein